ncbi:MAG: hypothetical protein Kow00121_33030 [Elainellaceae cyanobacterium]
MLGIYSIYCYLLQVLMQHLLNVVQQNLEQLQGFTDIAIPGFMEPLTDSEELYGRRTTSIVSKLVLI